MNLKHVLCKKGEINISRNVVKKYLLTIPHFPPIISVSCVTSHNCLLCLEVEKFSTNLGLWTFLPRMAY